MVGSRIKFMRGEDIIQNVFMSKHFLTLCGFSSQQLDCVPISYRADTGIFFNLSTIVELVGDDGYCGMNSPPSNLDIVSSSLGAGVHNFTKSRTVTY